MSDARDAEIDEFLVRAGWGGSIRTKLAGDASTRSYERVTLNGRIAILMNQPRRAETEPCPADASDEERTRLGYNALARLAAGRVDAFVATASYLTQHGFSAPEVYAADPAAGLAVIEDLGDELYARLLEQGADEAALYDAAIDALAALQRLTPPDALPGGWPFLAYDDLALKTAQDIILEWFPPYAGIAFSADAVAAWEAAWAPIRARGVAGATVFCHRDYHAENLLWLPDRPGIARVGLLDFQDAVRAHPAWDMSMLLHDARREIDPALEARCLARYHNAAQPDGAFMSDFHALGALNIVRIIGIFARLVTRDGKPRYRDFMPRMWRYLDRCLADPALGALKDWFDANVPREVRR